MDLEGLSSICAGLGSIEEEEESGIRYEKGEYCSDNLKDLLRFLRRDDPQSRNVFKQVCKWDIVAKNLLPIIEYCQEDRNLVLNAVKVLVFLTMPIDPSSSDINEQLEYLWHIKSAITCSDVVVVVVSLLEKPLEHLECDAFAEEDWKLIQLVLTLFRNILAVQDISAVQKASGCANHFLSTRDSFLEILFRENVMDLIIVLTQHVAGHGYLRHDNLLLLEIFYYIFIGQDPELIAKSYPGSSKVDEDAKACAESLRSIMEQEEGKKKQIRSCNLNRHSQFSGTFTRLTADGSKSLYKGVPTAANTDKLGKSYQVHRGPSKRVAWDKVGLPTTKRNVLEMLHDFINQFLSGGYNVLMQSVCEDIEKEHHAVQHSDVSNFFQLAQFVTSFQYHRCSMTKPNMKAGKTETSLRDDGDSTLFRGEICGPVAASLNESMFHLVLAKWRYAFEGLKETNDYKFLTAAGSLMRNMIRMLDLMLKLMPEGSSESQTAHILLYKLFYDQTDQGFTHFLLEMIKSFDTHKQPKSYLADLVEMIHVVVRLMENLQARGTLREDNNTCFILSIEKSIKLYHESSIMTDFLRALLVALDQLSKKPHWQGTVEAGSLLLTHGHFNWEVMDSVMVKVSKKSRKGRKKKARAEATDNVNEAVGDQAIASKTIPDAINIINETVGEKVTLGNGIHHSGSVDNEDTSSTQKQNCADSREGSPAPQVSINADEPFVLEQQNSESSPPQMDNGDPHIADSNYMYSSADGDSSGDEQGVTDEVDFKITTLLYSLACNSVLKNVCWLLKFYKTNSIRTNHYIISMLRRICDDLSLAPMLYQLSYIVTFYDILNEQQSTPSKDYENIISFLTTLVRRMLRKMKSQPLLFVEVLFLKSRRDCHLINAESMINEVHGLKKEVHGWGVDSENIDAGLSHGKESMHRSLADALGDDEYDVFIPHEPVGEEEDDSDQDVEEKFVQRSCESVDKLKKISKPIRNSLIDGNEENQVHANSVIDDVKGDSRRKRRLVLNDELEGQIRVLYEKFKDHKKCNQMIATALSPDGSITAAQVLRKLKKLGLFTSKRRTKQNMHMDDEVLDFDSGDGQEDSDDQILSSLRKRSKNEVNEASFKEISDRDAGGLFSADDSGDETLSSVLRKPRTSRGPVRKGNPAITAIEQPIGGDELFAANDDQDSDERDNIRNMGMDAVEGDAAVLGASSSGKEAVGINGGKDDHDTVHTPIERISVELVDSGDEMTSGASVKNSTTRRIRRMVIDDDDDE